MTSFKRLLEERSRLDPASLYEQSGLVGNWLRTWELSQVAQTFDTPSALLAAGSALNPLVPIRRYDKTEVGPNEWMIREWFEDGYAPFPEFCDFAARPICSGPRRVQSSPGRCHRRGVPVPGRRCLSVPLALAGPRYGPARPRPLPVRAELSEARARTAPGMITDLASNERYEDVLQGFVRSVDADRRRSGVHCWSWSPAAGVAPQDLFRRIARGGGGVDGRQTCWPGKTVPDKVDAVDVVSARRHYGVLAINMAEVSSPPCHSPLETHARSGRGRPRHGDALDEARHQANTARRSWICRRR